MKKEIRYFLVFIILSAIFWFAITLSEEYTINFNVPVIIELKEKNIAIEGKVPQYLSLKVRITGWEILKLKYFQPPELFISIKNPGDNLSIETSNIPNNQLKLSSDAKILDIKPAMINLTFNYAIEKKIKIYPVLDLSFKEGYDIASPITLEPDSIYIRGSRRLLLTIDSLPTKKVTLKDLSDFISVETELADTLTNLISFEKKKIKISFDVQQVVDKMFEKIPIEMINQPTNKEALLLPSFIDIKLRGGITILGSINIDSLKAFINYKKYANKSDEEIVPEFVLPFGVSVIDYYPKQFKIILRK